VQLTTCASLNQPISKMHLNSDGGYTSPQVRRAQKPIDRSIPAEKNEQKGKMWSTSRHAVTVTMNTALSRHFLAKTTAGAAYAGHRSMSTAAAVASNGGYDRMQSMEDRERVLNKFAEIRACAVLRTATSEDCPKAMQAAIDGGFKIVEFTLTTPDCLQHIANFRAKYDGNVMVGCGTILTPDDAAAAMDAGSEFIITPVLLPDVIEWCVARNIVVVPGCQTPTELLMAYRHGAPLQKLFPGVAGGPGWVKAVSGALPFLNINPTSGVDLDNAGEYLRAGAASVGLVAPLFDPLAIANKNWDQISQNAAKVMANVREVGPRKRK
jgi:2-dehydro-3-deoxyphosphogluconate aldolase / (4S)-4-hydroxy-2-oxoglutarate aldolase